LYLQVINCLLRGYPAKVWIFVCFLVLYSSGDGNIANQANSKSEV